MGRSGGAMVLGKLPVPGRPTNLDDIRARANLGRQPVRRQGGHTKHRRERTIRTVPGLGPTALAVGAGRVVRTFYLSLLSSFFLSLGNGRYRLKYCLKGPLSPKQPPNQLLWCLV